MDNIADTRGNIVYKLLKPKIDRALLAAIAERREIVADPGFCQFLTHSDASWDHWVGEMDTLSKVLPETHFTVQIEKPGARVRRVFIVDGQAWGCREKFGRRWLVVAYTCEYD